MTTKQQLTVRPANEADVPQIFRLLAFYAVKQIVLPRTDADIRYYLGNFTVCAADGDIVGCMAVRDFGNRLFEVRSLAVKPEFQGRGIGRMLLTAAVAFHCPEAAPDGGRFCRLTLLKADETAFR